MMNALIDSKTSKQEIINIEYRPLLYKEITLYSTIDKVDFGRYLSSKHVFISPMK